MLTNYSLRDAICTLHLAKAAGFYRVIIIRTRDYFGHKVLVIIPYTELLLHGIYNHYSCRILEL